MLIPRGLRDVLLSLADVKAFRPARQDEILDEVARNSPRVLRRQYDAEKAEQMTARALAQMAKAFPDAALSSELWTPVVSVMTNDVKDRHVLAAAVGAQATHVVTDNTRDFPVRSRPPGIKVVKPDAFLLELLVLDQDAVLGGVEAMASRHRTPPHTPVELVTLLAGGRYTKRFGARLLQMHAAGEWQPG